MPVARAGSSCRAWVTTSARPVAGSLPAPRGEPRERGKGRPRCTRSRSPCVETWLVKLGWWLSLSQETILLCLAAPTAPLL